MVNIQHDALSAFKQHLAARTAGLMQRGPDITQERLQPLTMGHQAVNHVISVDAINPGRIQPDIVVISDCADLFPQGLTIQQVRHADTAPRHLVFIGRADTPARGADLALTAQRLTGVIHHRMHRQDHRRGIRNHQIVVADGDPLADQRVHFSHQCGRVNNNTIADHRCFARANDTGGQQAQFIFGAFDHQRVARVVTALKPDNDIGLF